MHEDGIVIFDGCGGIATMLHAAAVAQVKVRAYKLLEVCPMKRKMAQYYATKVAHKWPEFLSMDVVQSMFSDIPDDIWSVKSDPDIIRRLGHVDLFCLTWPCQGFSKGNVAAQGPADVRSQIINVGHYILELLREANPAVQHFAENTFALESDWPGSFRAVCGAFGTPLKFDAALVSPSHRLRLYWISWLKDKKDRPQAKDDADWESALDSDHVPPFARSSDKSPFAAFNRTGFKARKAPTVLSRPNCKSIRDGRAKVFNIIEGQLELPRVHELEKMLGLLPGATDHPDVSEAERRAAIGNVVDRCVYVY